MSLKRWLIGSFVLFVMVFSVTTQGSLDVLAESDDVTKPMETGNAMVVELNDNNFVPKVITIPTGKTTTLTLINKGQREHTFTVKELGIDVEVQPGKEQTITVTPEKPGTYELICRYHFQQGMVGQVVVN